MNDNHIKIIFEILAETIRRLRVDVILLKGENERLKEKIAIYEKPTEKAGADNA